MAADILSSEMKSRLHLTTKTVGADRIRKAKENNEDVAVLSMFLPNASAVEENRNFYCALGTFCRQGDARKTTAGKTNNHHFPLATENAHFPINQQLKKSCSSNCWGATSVALISRVHISL